MLNNEDKKAGHPAATRAEDVLSPAVGYDDPIELYIARLDALLEPGYGIPGRALALLLLQGDQELIKLVEERQPGSRERIREVLDEALRHYAHPISYIIGVRRQQEASRIAHAVMHMEEERFLPLRERFSRLLMNPMIGAPVLLAILYYGLYKFVGTFGAGVLVDFLEDQVFGAYVNPFMTALVERLIPLPLFSSLFVGEYGIITLGVRYACAIILPVVGAFFFAFAIIEDSGYLPRLAMLVDALFKRIGLSGRAVIPLVLGFGCATMATMVTRTLPTKRERVIATLLLALAIPCSAQMGVIMALLAGRALGVAVWLGVILLVFLIVGFLASRIMPGELPSFYMEIPPLRLPRISNVLRKTGARLKWYFFEVMPLFILASVLIWLGQITGIFDLLVHLMRYVVTWIGLPGEASVSFLFGFFRRDYGAAGLYDLKKSGLLSGQQLVVACVTLTLFLPCVAQLLMNIKERGLRMGVAMSGFILVFSITTGYLVNLALTLVRLPL